MGVDSSRHFKNRAASSTTSSSTSSNGGGAAKRQEENWDAETCTTVARQLMKKCLEHYEGISRGQQKNRSMGTLYHGALGARVYLRYRMAQHLKSLKAQGPSTKKVRSSSRSASDGEINDLLKEALKTAREAVEIETERMQRHEIRVSLLEGALVGAKALLAAILHYVGGREQEANEEATELLELLEEHTASLDSAECEVLYGRAGAIQAILFLRHEFGDETFGSELVIKLAQVIVEEGLKKAAEHNNDESGAASLPLLWQWHGSTYLGAAHGVVGILHTLLCLTPAETSQISVNGTKGELLPVIKETIRALNDVCWAESGNLKSSLESSSSSDKLVHWCHGCPGHVLLLVKGWEIFHDSSYLEQARKLGNNVLWPRGLLRKGVGLCHGISGNAYAMLALERPTTSSSDKQDKKMVAATGEGEGEDPKFWMKRACYFAAFSLENWSKLASVPDQPYSVYIGAGGLALLMMDLGTLTRQFTITGETSTRDARFPLYDF